MWILVIVLLNQMAGISPVTLLQTHLTSQECYSERTRIGEEMAKAYPDEHNFRDCRSVQSQQRGTTYTNGLTLDD